MEYQINLTEEQEQAVLHFVKKNHYDYVKGLLILAGLSLFALYSLIRYPDMNLKSHIYAWMLLIINGICFVVRFVDGIGLEFGLHCDYACLKHGKYTIDFRQSAGKLPENGKKYYVADMQGNQYRCLKFLDYRNSGQGQELLCIHLENGRHYAFPEKGESA